MLSRFQFFGLVFILDKFIFYQREKTLSHGLKFSSARQNEFQGANFCLFFKSNMDPLLLKRISCVVVVAWNLV